MSEKAMYDRLQVKACNSLFNIRVKGGMSNEEAFVTAIVDASDECLGEAIRKRPEMVRQMLKQLDKKGVITQ